MREISDEGKVKWIEKNAKGELELSDVELEDAVTVIREIVGQQKEIEKRK